MPDIDPAKLALLDTLTIDRGSHSDFDDGHCSLDECARAVVKRGLCNMHYQRERTSGRLKPLSFIDRLARKTERIGDCWVWQGALRTGGYPSNSEHRKALAHKLGRPVRAGFDACHTCDNRACVRPEHLYEGTRRQNMADCTDRGRHNKPTGSSHWSSTIPDDMVREIRNRVRAGESGNEVARQLGIHSSTVSRIVRGIHRAEVSA